MEAQRKRVGVRMFIAYFFIWLGTFVTINVVQAIQTGSGFGIGDTKVIPHDQLEPYFPPANAANAGGRGR